MKTFAILLITLSAYLCFAQTKDARLNFYPPANQPQPPPDLVKCIVSKEVEYFDKTGTLRAGQIIINKDLAEDIVNIFKEIKEYNQRLPLEQQFPITSVIPVSDSRFNWSDNASMAADNTSSYNYRKKTGGLSLSLHAVGRAIDINTFCNPYIKLGSPQLVKPKGASYNPQAACAISRSTKRGLFIVNAFLSRGWQWGGDWTKQKDYQHFEKPDSHGQNPKEPYCKPTEVPVELPGKKPIQSGARTTN